MTPQNNLDLRGDFRSHSFVELLVEIIHARLSGSLRLSRAKEKVIIYFRNGTLVYAVSNAREQRLFSVLLNQKKIDQRTLAQVPDFANDLELASALESKKIFSKEQIDDFVALQIDSIIVEAIGWKIGDWIFSPLTRFREDLIAKVDVHKVLVDYARCLPSHMVSDRFKSVHESFHRGPRPVTSAIFQSHETDLLELFNSIPRTIQDIRLGSNLSEAVMLQSLYVLWVGGQLVRNDWNSAFTAAKIEEILSTKVNLIKQAPTLSKPEPAVSEDPALDESVVDESENVPDEDISLEDYLERVENAETFYDVLGIDTAATPAEIKRSYFAMAKLFHPDRFHREEAGKLRRIQVAFTAIAHAYETLKTPESRETYNFRMRKEIEKREKRKAEGRAVVTPEDRQAEGGLESFEKGLAAFAEEEFAAAAGHLARAVHYSPKNALYHAYFGQALSQLEKQHHKAEASLQMAVKLDPSNPKIRMMLVEFFLEIKMTRRAVGELTRFLEIVPGNKEAAKMLADLQPPPAVGP